MSVLPSLRERIETSGAITVAEYMEICNAHYYGLRDPFGQTGDFTTAPEISQIFGELIGAWLAGCSHESRAVLCELGPGRGTLMKDLLRATRKQPPYFHENIRVRLLESSATLRGLQHHNLHDMHHDVAWVSSIEELPSLPLLLVANEFFDALGVHQEVKTAKGWVERCVTLQDGQFTFTPEGSALREHSPERAEIMRSIAAHIKRYGGAALIIDYGYEHSAEGDTLQAIHQHAFCSPLQKSGEADITSHVDFGALQNVVNETGLSSFLTTQGEFLRRLGAELRATVLCKSASDEQRKQILSGLERLISPQQMGALFKVFAVTSSLEKPPGF